MPSEEAWNIDWEHDPPGVLGAERAEDRAARRLQQQASELGLPVDEYREILAENPRYARSLRERAARASTTVKELLDHDRRAAGNREYPGPECLRPHEVEGFLEGTLSEARLGHTETCVPCSVLLEGATVPPNASALVEEMRSVAAQSLAARAELEDANSIPLPPRRTSITEAVTEAMVVVFAFLIPAFLVRALELVRGAEPLTGPRVLTTVQITGAMLLFTVVAAILLVRTFPPKMSRLAGVTAAACGLVLFLSLGTSVGYKTQSLAIASSEDRFSAFALNLLAARASTGSYPSLRTDVGPLKVETRPGSSASTATYAASAEGLPGLLIAELYERDGTLSLQGEHQGRRKATPTVHLILGLVSQRSGNNVVVRDTLGLQRTFVVADPELTALQPGDSVGIAVRLGDLGGSRARLYAVGPTSVESR